MMNDEQTSPRPHVDSKQPITDPQQPTKAGSLYERIYEHVRAVPAGCVTTYGAVGAAAGCPARVVGYAMHYLGVAPRPDVPWQRVINARGGISTHGAEQRRLLEGEGVMFRDDGTVDLDRFGWWGFELRIEN